MKNLSHIGDILAIPFFLLLTIYFYKIINKTPLEWILFIFVIIGLIADLFFTYIFFVYKNNLYRH